MQKLSAFVTTYNNDDTLAQCLESVAWADEIVVLDSYSDDDTLAVARRYGAAIFQHAFQGYGPQKQMALEHTSHQWVLLLDADEMLSPELQSEIRALLADEPAAAGYELPRREQIFWRMNHPGVRLNYHLRLFDKRRGHLTDIPVHAAPEVDGPVGRLRHPFYHFGECSIHAKVEKIDAYSTGLVAEKIARGGSPNPLVMVFYPPWYFFRSFILKRAFMDGWAGFIAAVVMAFYAFLKYAKRYEHAQFARYGETLLPAGAPRRNGASRGDGPPTPEAD